MKRLYFLLPNIETTRKVVDEFLLARIEARHIHVIGPENMPLDDLPQASLLQKSDFLPAMERGVALGGVTGAMAGLASLAMPGVTIAGGAVLAMGIVGAGMGAWLGGMIGLDVDNVHTKKFESAVKSGNLLVLVDVPKDHVDEVCERVRLHYPEANFGGAEPTIPAFP
ncbi:MAG: DUF1269 domain-containing protein [Gammaproteobacteria bacterium]